MNEAFDLSTLKLKCTVVGAGVRNASDILRHKSGLRWLFCCNRPKNNGKPGGWAGLSYAPHGRVHMDSIAEQGCGTFNQQSELSTNSLCAPPTHLSWCGPPSALQDTFRLNTQFMRPPNVKQGQLRGKRANARRLACLRKERMCATQPVASFNVAPMAGQVKAATAVAVALSTRALLAPDKECTT